MDLVLDTDIVLDHIDRREPFYELSRKVCLLGVVEAVTPEELFARLDERGIVREEVYR